MSPLDRDSQGQPRGRGSSVHRFVFLWQGRDTPGSVRPGDSFVSLGQHQGTEMTESQLDKDQDGTLGEAHRLGSAPRRCLGELSLGEALSSTQSTALLCVNIHGTVPSSQRWKQPGVQRQRHGQLNLVLPPWNSLQLREEGDRHAQMDGP